MHTSTVEIALRWHAAAGSGDAETLRALSAPDIEIVGPRGTAHGTQALDDWLHRAGLIWTALRTFEGPNGAVVVESEAVWQADPATATVVASHFTVHSGRVVRFARHADVAHALRAADIAP
ncbi:hypothetical protein Val02_17530 [Virgisporangium aliadipatigenens]|uniref:SnoaL-like domain-containing protein n=1 Tax=Virgisporangium aliadipatigenens TaxID=741659 RepID=A0A8J3YI61_9ACTN|nr:nuclear transport factor 2 family protein [Virgisporangium aliadipatigenens]GIJ44867.1 hypothetical protein Val02_17530 [Virgisporangium aliadipatigenens]